MSNVDVTITVTPARSPADISATKALLEAYHDALGLDLSFQSFEQELASLPGKYVPPKGELLLARLVSGVVGDGPVVVGCLALRPIDAERCELKRLYTAPNGRRRGVAGLLLDTMIAKAKEMGYRQIVLDTLKDKQKDAVSVYRKRGFVEIDGYYDTPLEGTLFLGRDL